MKSFILFLLILARSGTVWAQESATTPPPSAAPALSAAELEKLAAPIALHPDPLVAIILPASVYPLEIVQAARFIKDTNNLPKLDAQTWDENVKALAKFPAMIQTMNDDLTWTMDLGQAFLAQPKELMDTIQLLRGKASSAGVLKTTPQQVIVITNTIVQTAVEQQIVYVTNTVVQIQPANPQVVYIPSYPTTIYYPPAVYVGPPPILTFAAGIAVGAIIANNCDWHGGGIYVGHHGVAVWGGGGYNGHGNVNINGDVNINTGNNFSGSNFGNINSGNRNSVQKWQPDQNRINTAGAAGSRSSTKSPQSRGWSPSGGSAGRSGLPSSNTGSRANPGSQAAPARSYNRPSAGSSYSRPSSASRASAFGGYGSGSSARASSNRGSFSRGGGGRSFGRGRR